MKRLRKKPTTVRERVGAVLETLPGGLYYRMEVKDVDWEAAEAKLTPKAKAALMERRAEAARTLVELRPVVASMTADKSIAAAARRLAKQVLRMVDNRDLPAEGRLLCIQLVMHKAPHSEAMDDFWRLFPPRRGALPVPDDTPWAPPRRSRARKH